MSRSKRRRPVARPLPLAAPRPASRAATLAHYVQGWKIANRGDNSIRLEPASWFITAHAVVDVDDGQPAIALFVRYDRPIAALVWPPVSIMHRRAVPAMLRQALRAR